MVQEAHAAAAALMLNACSDITRRVAFTMCNALTQRVQQAMPVQQAVLQKILRATGHGTVDSHTWCLQVSDTHHDLKNCRLV